MYNMAGRTPRVSRVCFNVCRNKIMDKYIVHSLIQIYCSEFYLFILQTLSNVLIYIVLLYCCTLQDTSCYKTYARAVIHDEC